MPASGRRDLSDETWDWEALRRRCLRVARRYVRGPGEAEDVAQRALLRAWVYRDRCAEPAAPAAWVASICRNEALRALAERRNGEVAFEEQADGGVAGDLEALAERVDVRQALARLPAADRRLLWLRYGLDLTQPAVAEIAGIPEGTAKVRLHRLRAALREQLGDHG
jgi:RNA polymerase sigma-70 factor (ECF subfamily)